jgi:endonuclease/exonuclease/phosphatase family metal-dependent hydrolase
MGFGILTLNLWNINEPLEARYAALESGLRRLLPDIVCLHEVDRDPKSGQSQAELVATMCGHAHVVADNGLAIVCSSPVMRSSSLSLPEFPGDFSRRALSAELSIGGRPLLVTNTHLAHRPEMIEERRKQVEILLAAIKHPRTTGRSVARVLCGDFNDTADSPAVRAVLDSEAGLQDVFAACCPDSPGITYSCHNRYVDPSWTLDQRIDYFLPVASSLSRTVPSSSTATTDLSSHPITLAYFAVLPFVESTSRKPGGDRSWRRARRWRNGCRQPDCLPPSSDIRRGFCRRG